MLCYSGVWGLCGVRGAAADCVEWVQVWDNNHNRDFHTLVEKDVDRETLVEETYKRLLAESLDHDTESANRAGVHAPPPPALMPRQRQRKKPTCTLQPYSANARHCDACVAADDEDQSIQSVIPVLTGTPLRTTDRSSSRCCHHIRPSLPHCARRTCALLF